MLEADAICPSSLLVGSPLIWGFYPKGPFIHAGATDHAWGHTYHLEVLFIPIYPQFPNQIGHGDR